MTDSRYALECRKLAVKVTQQTTHIEMLDERIRDLQKSIRKANEVIDDMWHIRHKLERFVRFAEEFYPGCVEQYNAINKLEGDK